MCFGIHVRIGARKTALAQQLPAVTPEAMSMKQKKLYEIHHADAFDWLAQRRRGSIHAVVTDPPFGLVEYEPKHLAQRRAGRGGLWRQPPRLDGCQRQPVPRFTVLSLRQHQQVRRFFHQLGGELVRVIVPGAHVFIATTQLLSHHACRGLEDAGLQKRGVIVRVVKTLRGGDRPKGAHTHFRDVSVMPRACWEPWLLFRKPIEARVQDNLRKWGTGALHRPEPGKPFADLILSAPATKVERRIAPHPSLKPQAFMRQLVHAALPLGKGVILDPFMGSGSTLAAATGLGLRSIGVERNREYHEMARRAIPELAAR